MSNSMHAHAFGYLQGPPNGYDGLANVSLNTATAAFAPDSLEIQVCPHAQTLTHSELSSTRGARNGGNEATEQRICDRCIDVTVLQSENGLLTSLFLHMSCFRPAWALGWGPHLSIAVLQVIDSSISNYRGSSVGIVGTNAGLIGMSTTANPLEPLHFTLAFENSTFTLSSFLATASITDGLELQARWTDVTNNHSLWV